MPIPRDEIALVVHEMIVKDLRFSGVEINDAVVLGDGGLGLDSLDLLMLVTGIDKKFGYKIPQKKLNRDTMGSVGRFVDFVHSELAAAGR